MLSPRHNQPNQRGLAMFSVFYAIGEKWFSFGSLPSYEEARKVSEWLLDEKHAHSLSIQKPDGREEKLRRRKPNQKPLVTESW